MSKIRMLMTFWVTIQTTLVLSPLVAQTTRIWTGGSGTAWENSDNWTPPGIPLTDDDVAFIRGPTTSSLNQAFLLSGFRVETNHHRLELNGYSLEITNVFSIFTNLQGTGTNRWIIDGNGGLLQVGTSSNPIPRIQAGCKMRWDESPPFGAEMFFSNVTVQIYADEFILGYNANRDRNPYVTWLGSTLTVFQVNRFFLGDNAGATAELAAVTGGRIQMGSPDAKCNLFLGVKRYRENPVWGVIRATNWIWTGSFGVLSLASGTQPNYQNGFGFIEIDEDDELEVDNLYVGGYTNIGGTGYFFVRDGSALRIGRNLSERGNLFIGYSPGSGARGTGQVEIATGFFQAFLTNLYVGYVVGGHQHGLLRLGPTNQIHAHSLIVGRGAGWNSWGVGELNAVSNGVVSLGSPDVPIGLMAIGLQEGDSSCSGRVSALTWKLNAHISTLWVGRCTSSGTGRGFLELDGDDVINVSTMRVATRTSGSVVGGVRMMGGIIRASHVVEIGSPASSTAWFTNTLPGVSGGLDFTGSSLTINGQYHIIFNPPRQGGPYWGLRWSGNRTNELTTLVNNGRITWDGSALPPEQQAAVGVYYDPQENFSYVGFRHAKAGSVMVIR